MSKRVTREEIDLFVSLRKEGKTKDEISKTTGRSISVVTRYLLEEGFSKEDLSDSWRKDLLQKLVKPDPEYVKQKGFWITQYRELNKLMKEFPNLEFWKTIKVKNPLKSLYFFKYDKNKAWLKKKYDEFNYKPQYETPTYELSEKVGEDKNIKTKKKTTRGFLNG